MTEHLNTARATADTKVATAVQEADEAANLAAALEERVRDGDDTVTPEQIASARELGHFAQLRADATRRKAEQTKRDARLTACEELRTEMASHQRDRGARYAQHLMTAEKALRAFLADVEADNEQHRQWRQRMHELDIPEHNTHLAPSDEHAGLGYSKPNLNFNSLVAGDLRIRATNAEHWLALMLTRITRDTRGLSRLERATTGLGNGSDMYERLAAIDGTAT